MLQRLCFLHLLTGIITSVSQVIVMQVGRAHLDQCYFVGC